MEITVELIVTDGDDKHIGNGNYRSQIEYTCDVRCRLDPGTEDVRHFSNGDPGHPGEGPSVEVLSVEVTKCVIFARPDYRIGVDVDSRDDNHAEFLKAHATWCRGHIESAMLDELLKKVTAVAA